MSEKQERKWEIWREGYHVNEGKYGALLMGTEEAETFREACIKFFARDPKHKEYFNPNRYKQHPLAYWGCCLFDNEADARKRFG